MWLYVLRAYHQENEQLILFLSKRCQLDVDVQILYLSLHLELTSVGQGEIYSIQADKFCPLLEMRE